MSDKVVSEDAFFEKEHIYSKVWYWNERRSIPCLTRLLSTLISGRTAAEHFLSSFNFPDWLLMTKVRYNPSIYLSYNVCVLGHKPCYTEIIDLSSRKNRGRIAWRNGNVLQLFLRQRGWKASILMNNNKRWQTPDGHIRTVHGYISAIHLSYVILVSWTT